MQGRICSFYPMAYHVEYPITCSMNFLVCFLLFEGGGWLYHPNSYKGWAGIYFCHSMSVWYWVYHKLLLSLAFLDHFITFMSAQSEKLCHWCSTRLSRTRRNIQQISWMYCLACCFEELVFVWDIQCYNVNTGDADDLLCENLFWGLCYQRNLELDNVQ